MPSLDEIIKAYGHIDDLENFKRPMFVGPHPDDIEFGCGGLISKLKELKTPVIYVIVTDGAAGSDNPDIAADDLAKIRKNETLKAAEYMNIQEVEFLDLEDGGNFEVEDVIRKLAPVVLKYQPDIIFAPDSQLKTECHSDHIKTGEAVRRLTQIIGHPVALKRHNIDVSDFNVFPSNITLAFYFTDDPNKKVFFEERNLQEKITSLMCHSSQMSDNGTELLINYFKLKAIKLGEGQGLAEDYKVLVPLTQHVYAEGVHYED